MTEFWQRSALHPPLSAAVGFAHDLDGTVNIHHGRYPAEILAMFKEAHEAGLIQIPVTGQAFHQSRSTVLRCVYATGFVLSDGGLVVAHPALRNDGSVTFNEVARRYFTGEQAMDVIDALRRTVREQGAQRTGPLSIAMDIDETRSDSPLQGHTLREAEFDWAWHTPSKVVAGGQFRVRADLPGSIAKILINCPPYLPSDEFHAILAHVPAELGAVYSSKDRTATISPPGVNKDTGLTILAHYLGIDPQLLVRYGDYLNDIPLAQTGRLFTPNNGHPLVKQAALASGGGVIGSVHDFGVARHMREEVITAVKSVRGR